MKKIISILLIIVLVVSCCACSVEPETTLPESSEAQMEQTEATLEVDPFADVDELTPVDGVYQICSAKGVFNIAQHPDAKFELLCDVDLGGAEWIPVGTQENPFTGKLNGWQFTISNFVIKEPTKDGDMGFFGVSAGDIRNLTLSDMTITTTPDTVRVGGLVGSNSGAILRSNLVGSLIVESVGADAYCGGVAGINSGKIETVVADVDILCNAQSEATIGGFVGEQSGGVLWESDACGMLQIANGGNKTVGLFAGTAENVEMKNNVYLGESNTVDGQVYKELIGAQENVSNIDWSIRDNSAQALPADIQALRDQVEAKMRAMGTVEWTVSQHLPQSVGCGCCKPVMYMAGKNYRGIPYSHKGGSLDRFMYCLDENNVIEDWVYELEGFDGWDLYIGVDCFGAIKFAYTTVSDSLNIRGTLWQLPVCGQGTIPVGDWVWDIPVEETNYLTQPYVEATGVEQLYEAYAQLRKGDCVGNRLDIGGHTRMLACDAVVVRDAEGKIDPDRSYVLTHEQGGGGVESAEYISSWRIDYQYSFETLAESYYVPFTIPELVEGTQVNPVVTLEDGTEGWIGMTTGVVVSDYFLDSVEMVLTEEDGTVVYADKMFVSVDKMSDTGSDENVVKVLVKEFDLAHFATALRGILIDAEESYHCVITAHLNTGDSIVVKDYTF